MYQLDAGPWRAVRRGLKLGRPFTWAEVSDPTRFKCRYLHTALALGLVIPADTPAADTPPQTVPLRVTAAGLVAVDLGEIEIDIATLRRVTVGRSRETEACVALLFPPAPVPAGNPRKTKKR